MADAGETTRGLARERLDFIERIADASPMIIYSFDLTQHRILYANRSLAQFLGYDDRITEQGDDWVAALVHPDDLSAYQGALDDYASSAERQVVHSEFRVRRVDGRYEWLSNWVTVSDRDATGQPTQIVGATAIVTARKQVEAEKLASEARLRLLADHAHDIIVCYRVHPNVAVEYISPSVETITGYAPHELMADPELYRKLIHPDDRPRLETMLSDVATAATRMLTLRWITKLGEVVYLEQHVVPRHDTSGRLVGVEIIARDVTEKALLEEQLRQAQKVEALGTLAGGIAHDYNNLLGVTLGYVSVLKQELGNNSRAMDAVEAVEESARRAATLTRRLLSFARPAPVQAQLLSVNEVLHDVEGMLRRLLPEDIELVLYLEPGLPSVLADAGQLEQVVINLVINARDAMPAGGTLSIFTGRSEGSDPHHVRLEVRDTGSGMDEATRQRVFEPFFTTKPLGKGTGLGLSTVHGIVAQSEGTIEVKSQLGLGSTFTVRLPAREGQAVRRISEPIPIAPDFLGATVLLVEDEPTLRGLVRRTLTTHGYRVIDAPNAESALALSEQFRGDIDLMLTDVVMPRMSGPALAASVARLRPGTRVLYMSGHALDDVLRYGIDDHDAIIEKPFAPEDLVWRVAEVLAGAQPELCSGVGAASA